MQGEQEERSNGWDAATDGRSNGWPLGLQPVSARLSSTSSHFHISPSLTSSSSSSSDFGTQSSGSFFPEKSTTLGSLIGIQSSSQNASVQSHSIDDERLSSKNSSGSNRTRLWCPLLGCGGGLQDDPLEASPSLAHLLDRERRDTLSQRQATGNSVGWRNHREAAEQEESDIDQIVPFSDPLYGSVCTIPSDRSRVSLRLILQQPSPISAYPSTDWNVCSHLSHYEHYQGDASPIRSHTFWPNLCGKS